MLFRSHISGQLRVAPEHICSDVLAYMGKPSAQIYKQFLERYDSIERRHNKKQYVLPYLMSSHPGSTLKDAIQLAEYINQLGYMPEQVQDFYPTPSTISTCMYYTGMDPFTRKKVFVAQSPHDKALQRALIQFKKPENHKLVMEALRLENRMDLVGFDKKCLIPPRVMKPKDKEKDKLRNSKSNKVYMAKKKTKSRR